MTHKPGEGSAYDYTPEWIEIPPLYANENVDDPTVLVKLFTPDGSWTWYILEWDAKDTFFGLVDGMEEELGYFSLSELKSARGQMGLPIERDLWFEPRPLSEVRNG